MTSSVSQVGGFKGYVRGELSLMATVVAPDAKKWLQSSFYKEALENVVGYNAQLMRERRSRLPYVDAQTGIAQSDSYNWKKRSERQRGILPGQVYSYVPKRWRLEPKGQSEGGWTRSKEPVGTEGKPASVSPTSGLIQTLEGGVLTKRSSRIASRKDVGEGVAMPVGSKVVLESPGSSEHNEEEESPDMDLDYLDDYDSDEEKRSHRKKKRPTSSRVRPPPSSSSSSSRSSRTSDHDKPFLCKLCKRRYKTVASLKAHTTQYHGRDISASSSPVPQPTLPTPTPTPSTIPTPEEKVPVFLRPPSSLQGKPLAKPNPICDFCLGDNTLNKKTSRPEKLVSCADCGRSGHPTCMQFSSSLSVVVRTYRWQCIECKTCHICGTSENDDQLLFCDDCDRGYHMYCLKPPIKEPPEGNWSCGMCLKPVSALTPADVIPNITAISQQ